MFGRLGKKSEEMSSLPAGLDRIGRRASADGKLEATVAPDRDARLAAAAATLRDIVEPKLRELLKSGAPAGEVTRQAGNLTQIHFRSNGVPLAPLELRVHVAEVLRPVLPATAFSRPTAQPQPETALPDPAENAVEAAPVAAAAAALPPPPPPLRP